MTVALGVIVVVCYRFGKERKSAFHLEGRE